MSPLFPNYLSCVDLSQTCRLGCLFPLSSSAYLFGKICLGSALHKKTERYQDHYRKTRSSSSGQSEPAVTTCRLPSWSPWPHTMIYRRNSRKVISVRVFREFSRCVWRLILRRLGSRRSERLPRLKDIGPNVWTQASKAKAAQFDTPLHRQNTKRHQQWVLVYSWG